MVIGDKAFNCRSQLTNVAFCAEIVRGMLNGIPTVLGAHFVSINIKLTFYENPRESSALLESAIWKSKITEHRGQKNDSLLTNTRKKRHSTPYSFVKIQCRFNSIVMVAIIVSSIVSFLTDM